MPTWQAGPRLRFLGTRVHGLQTVQVTPFKRFKGRSKDRWSQHTAREQTQTCTGKQLPLSTTVGSAPGTHRCLTLKHRKQDGSRADPSTAEAEEPSKPSRCPVPAGGHANLGARRSSPRPWSTSRAGVLPVYRTSTGWGDARPSPRHTQAATTSGGSPQDLNTARHRLLQRPSGCTREGSGLPHG